MNRHIDNTIIRVLTDRWTVQLAILFGSLASGKGTPVSDLDLAVDLGRKLTAEEKMALIGDLATALGRPVDLIDLRNVGEPLLGEIVTGGRRIMGADVHYAELIRRHLFDQADFLPYRSRILAERRRSWIGE